MSEKLYALLLRLYPERFRRSYGDEAMQVFRDRLRDERGVLKRTRLWLSLLLDCSVSAPREHRRTPASPAPSPTGLPSFLVLEEEPLRPHLFLFGTALGLLALGTFAFLMTHGGNRVLFPAMSAQNLRSSRTTTVSTDRASQRHPQSSGPQSKELPVLTTAERQMVMQKVIAVVQQYDPYAEESRSVAALLSRHESQGDYEDIHNGPFFAQLLTQQIAGVTRYSRITVLCDQFPAAGMSLPAGTIFETIDSHFSITLTSAGKP